MAKLLSDSEGDYFLLSDGTKVYSDRHLLIITPEDAMVTYDGTDMVINNEDDSPEVKQQRIELAIEAIWMWADWAGIGLGYKLPIDKKSFITIDREDY